MRESTGGPLWPDRDAKHDPLENLQRAMELVETHGHHPEPDPVSPGMFRRLRSWFSSRLQAFDESHVVDLGDADDAPDLPEMRCVIEDAGPHPDTEVPPIRYDLGDPDAVELGQWRERFRSSRLIWLPLKPVEVSCAFCPNSATEEIFVGWANPPGATDGPPTAQFARVCINHVGHSRFTRSERPVDEL